MSEKRVALEFPRSLPSRSPTRKVERRRDGRSRRSPLSAERIEELRQLGERYAVSNIRVFGSFARGEAGPDSDLDLLVSLDYRRGVAHRFLRFCEEASRMLGMKVDVLTERALDAQLHAPILREARPL